MLLYRAQALGKYGEHGGPAVCVRFDECDATRQQRACALLFIELFRGGLAARGWASDAYMPLAALCLQTGKSGAAGLRSADSSIVGARWSEPAWRAGGCPPPPPCGSL